MSECGKWLKEQINRSGILKKELPRDGEKKFPNPWVIGGLVLAILFLAVSGRSSGEGEKTETEEVVQNQTSVAVETWARTMEVRLTEVLEQMEGVGAVSVFLTMDSQGEKIPAVDRTQRTEVGEGRQETEDTSKVVLREEDREEAPWVVEERLPMPCGVLVVAEGARSEAVRLEIQEAVEALFGLAPHRIKITY